MSETRVIVSRPIVGIAHMQVCAVTDVTDEEILAVCNRENPSGTELGWVHVCREREDERNRPVQCESDKTRTHFLVNC
jgi:hypothetical protein